MEGVIGNGCWIESGLGLVCCFLEIVRLETDGGAVSFRIDGRDLYIL